MLPGLTESTEESSRKLESQNGSYVELAWSSCSGPRGRVERMRVCLGADIGHPWGPNDSNDTSQGFFIYSGMICNTQGVDGWASQLMLSLVISPAAGDKYATCKTWLSVGPWYWHRLGDM